MQPLTACLSDIEDLLVEYGTSVAPLQRRKSSPPLND
jgi:hypothetical protein